MVYYIVCFVFTVFSCCPCMAIDVSVQYNDGLLPDIILLTQCYLVIFIGEPVYMPRRDFVFAAFDPT